MVQKIIPKTFQNHVQKDIPLKHQGYLSPTPDELNDRSQNFGPTVTASLRAVPWGRRGGRASHVSPPAAHMGEAVFPQALHSW